MDTKQYDSVILNCINHVFFNCKFSFNGHLNGALNSFFVNKNETTNLNLGLLQKIQLHLNSLCSVYQRVVCAKRAYIERWCDLVAN